MNQQIGRNLLIALTLTTLVCFPKAGFSQVNFEKGYFISNENVKTECFIRNRDWHYNPVSFDYKVNEQGKVQTANIENVKEFGIIGYSKYTRATVKMDMSKDYNNSNVDELSDSSNPQWEEKTIFLKSIHEGAAILYSYDQVDISRYFYSVGSNPTEQLVYKSYKTSQLSIGYNNGYLNQLADAIDCGDLKQSQLPKTDYREKSLKKYFEAYDKCKGVAVGQTTAQSTRKTNHFAVSIFAGMTHASLQTQNNTGYYIDGSGNGVPAPIVKFDPKWTPLIGIEMEYYLPFNKDKWSIPLQIYNRSYSDSTTDVSGYSEVRFKAVEMAMGIRYYMYLNKDFKLFLDAMVVLDFKTDSYYRSSTTTGSYTNHLVDISTTAPLISGGVGIGYKKLSAEFRYNSARELFVYLNSYGSAFNSYSLQLKFQLFKF